MTQVIVKERLCFRMTIMAVRQRHADMLREAEENRRAHREGAQTNTEFVLNRIVNLLSFSWLSQSRQPNKVTTPTTGVSRYWGEFTEVG